MEYVFNELKGVSESDIKLGFQALLETYTPNYLDDLGLFDPLSYLGNKGVTAETYLSRISEIDDPLYDFINAL